MPRNGTPRSRASSTARSEPGGAQRLGAAPEGADPGQDHPRRAGGVVGVDDEPGVGPEVDEGLLGGSEVADAVVEDGDPCAHSHPAGVAQGPLGGGHTRTVDAHGVAQAARHPFERRLDDVVGVLAVTRRTCSVIPEAVTRARQNSSASCGSNGGEPSRRRRGRRPRRRRGRGAPRCRGPRPPGPRRGAGRSRRSGGCRPCPRAPRPAPRPARCPRPPRCGARRHRDRPWPRTREVEPAVATELREHVVEEREPGRHLDRARAVEGELDVDGRLLGPATAGGGAGRAHGAPSPGRPRSSSVGGIEAAQVTWSRPGAGPGPRDRDSARRGAEARAQGGQEPVVLLGRAHGDPQAVVEPRPARAVAHQHRARRGGRATPRWRRDRRAAPR